MGKLTKKEIRTIANYMKKCREWENAFNVRSISQSKENKLQKIYDKLYSMLQELKND